MRILQERVVMKLRTFLLLPILIAAILYAGVKGYVYFGVRGKIDHLQKLMAPFATLTYGKIETDLRGTVTVRDVALIPAGTNLEFRVKELELEGPDYMFLLTLAGNMNNSEAPDKAQLHFRQVSIPPDDDIMEQLSGLSPMSTGQADKIAPPEVCSLGGILQHIGMEKIGYGVFPIDFSIGYEYYRPAEELTLFSRFNRPGLESYNWSMVFKNMPEMNEMMAGSVPELGKIEGNYRVDKTYMKRMVDYCAGQAKETPQQFVEKLFNQPDSYYARNIGIIPGLGIRSALKSLLTGATDLEFSAYPLTVITKEMLSTYSAEELISALGLQISINGKRIPDISFTIPESFQEYDDEDSNDEDANPTEAYLRAHRKPRRYIKTDLGDLRQYIGARIHLYIKKEKKMRVGILHAVDDVFIDVQQRVSGGTFTAHIPRDTIASVEVLRTVE